MPWYKGLWFDHVLSTEKDVEAFNKAMDGAPAPEAALPEAPAAEMAEDAPADAGPDAGEAAAESSPAEAAADAAPADSGADKPADEASSEPAAPQTAEQLAAALEAAHTKAELVTMAEGLAIETKGMNKGQIAQAIAAAQTSTSA